MKWKTSVNINKLQGSLGKLILSKALIVSLFFFCILAFSFGVFAQDTWENDYEMWKDTYEEAMEILRLAEMAEALGNNEEAENLRNSALGNLEEKGVNFLHDDVPVDKCGDYAQALFDIAAVVGELLPGDTEKLFRRRVIEILNACPIGNIDLRIPMILFGSRWQIKFEYRRDYMPTALSGYHYLLALEGIFSVPELPSLLEILGTKQDLDELIQEDGWDKAFGWIKTAVLFMVIGPEIETSLNGIYQYSQDPTKYIDEEGRWHLYINNPGCPPLSVQCEYNLKVIIDSNLALGIILDSASYEEIKGIGGTEVHRHIDTRDGHIVERVYPYECDYKPQPAGFDSFYWDMVVPLKNGTYIVDKYDVYREIKVSLRCIDNSEEREPKVTIEGAAPLLLYPETPISGSPVLTLTAKGEPPGGTYRWSVLSAGEKIEFQSGLNGPSVLIKPIGPSQSRGDVVIKVTYTSPEGNATAQTSLTIHTPSSAIRVSEDLNTFNGPNEFGYDHTVRYRIHDQFGERFPEGDLYLDEDLIVISNPYNTQFEEREYMSDENAEFDDHLTLIFQNLPVPVDYLARVRQIVRAQGAQILDQIIVWTSNGVVFE